MLLLSVYLKTPLILVFSVTFVMDLTSVICIPKVGKVKWFLSLAAAIAVAHCSLICVDRLCISLNVLPQNLHLKSGILMT